MQSLNEETLDHAGTQEPSVNRSSDRDQPFNKPDVRKGQRNLTEDQTPVTWINSIIINLSF